MRGCPLAGAPSGRRGAVSPSKAAFRIPQIVGKPNSTGSAKVLEGLPTHAPCELGRKRVLHADGRSFLQGRDFWTRSRRRAVGAIRACRRAGRAHRGPPCELPVPLVPCCGKSKVPLGAPWGEGSAAPQTTSDCGEFSHWAAAPVLRGDRTPKTES